VHRARAGEREGLERDAEVPRHPGLGVCHRQQTAAQPVAILLKAPGLVALAHIGEQLQPQCLGTLLEPLGHSYPVDERADRRRHVDTLVDRPLLVEAPCIGVIPIQHVPAHEARIAEPRDGVPRIGNVDAARLHELLHPCTPADVAGVPDILQEHGVAAALQDSPCGQPGSGLEGHALLVVADEGDDDERCRARETRPVAVERLGLRGGGGEE